MSHASLRDLLDHAASAHGDRSALRVHDGTDWRTTTYRELREGAIRRAGLLASLGVKSGDRVGLLMDNRPEWPETYFGIVALGATVVPMDIKQQPKELAHVLGNSEAEVVVTTKGFVPRLQEAAQEASDLKTVMVEDAEDLPDGDRPAWRHLPMALAEVDAKTAEEAWSAPSVKRDDLASFIYTSGTTGKAKGVMLTHGNFLSNVEGCIEVAGLGPEDRFLLILPVHHAFAFTGNLLLPFALGAEIVFTRGIKQISQDLQETAPSVFIGVPLLMEKMYERIQGALAANKLAQILLKIGLRGLVVKKVRAQMGGALHLVVTGGAPCDPEVIRGFERLGVDVLEGYGLTEAAPVVSINRPGDMRPGTVGLPMPGIEVKIREPDATGEGEILVRGPNVMKGYFQNPEATADTIRDGWLHTGDLGRIGPEGHLSITGRAKNLIVNREGKNIYPEEIEIHCGRAETVKEILVLGYQGSGEKVGERVGMIVVPNEEAMPGLSREEMEAKVRAELKALVADLSDYKRPRKTHIRWEEFEKTSVGKIRRFKYKIEPD